MQNRVPLHLHVNDLTAKCGSLGGKILHCYADLCKDYRSTAYETYQADKVQRKAECCKLRLSLRVFAQLLLIVPPGPGSFAAESINVE